MRSGGAYIRGAIWNRLNNLFDFTHVVGMTEKPPITQRATSDIPEPYILVRSESSLEVDNVKQNTETREYITQVECITKFNTNLGGQTQADDMIDEVLLIIRDYEFDDIINDGYLIYSNVNSNVVQTTQMDEGGTFYKAIITFETKAKFIGLPQDRQPVATPEYAYALWEITPSATAAELYDAGTITPSTTYPNSNGWDFTSVDITLPAGADGTLTDGVYTIANDDVTLRLLNDINYEFETDPTVTTTLSFTPQWRRILSLRHGAASTDAPFTDDFTDVTGLRKLDNWDISFGTTSFTNQSITFTLEAGDRMYIIYDDSLPDLQAIRESTFNSDYLEFFDAPVTAGRYKYYLQTKPVSYAGSITVTLT